MINRSHYYAALPCYRCTAARCRDTSVGMHSLERERVHPVPAEGAESLSWKGNESHYTVLENWPDTK